VAHAFLGIYNVQTPAIVLIGRDGDETSTPLQIDIDSLRQRLEAPVYRELLMDPRDLMGAYLLDKPGLISFAGPGGLNTDLMPRVSLQAPRSAYEESRTRGRDNLMALLPARVPIPETMLTADDPEHVAAFDDEVQRFSEALGYYLEGESARLDSEGGVPGLVAALGSYSKAYRVAPQFRPARGMLLQAARAGDDLAEQIFPLMLERTPEERLVWREYLGYLQRKGDAPRLEAALEQGFREYAGPGSVSLRRRRTRRWNSSMARVGTFVPASKTS